MVGEYGPCWTTGLRMFLKLVGEFGLRHTFFPRRFVMTSVLTLSQTTNFRLFQTEIVCRRKFQIWWKWRKAFETGRKHWEKEKLLVTSNFSFSRSVFKRLIQQTRKNQGLFGKRLKIRRWICNHESVVACLWSPGWNDLEKHTSEPQAMSLWNQKKNSRLHFRSLWPLDKEQNRQKKFKLRHNLWKGVLTHYHTIPHFEAL